MRMKFCPKTYIHLEKTAFSTSPHLTSLELFLLQFRFLLWCFNREFICFLLLYLTMGTFALQFSIVVWNETLIPGEYYKMSQNRRKNKQTKTNTNKQKTEKSGKDFSTGKCNKNNATIRTLYDNLKYLATVMAVEMNLLLSSLFLKAYSFKQTQHPVRRLPNKESLDTIQAINTETALIWDGCILCVISSAAGGISQHTAV